MHRLDNSVDYVLDEKKASRSQNADSLQAAVDYALNKDKTEQDLFCSAIGCTLDSAFEDMCQIKRMWHKEKGVQGFHLVQSFAAGEVTPELAHQIGQELADRLLGGRFQVVISTPVSYTHLQGDASLDGAVYGMFKGETLLDTYTTSGGGKFTTKEYPCGPDYTIREISPSEGYLLDETVYPVGAEPGNFTLEHNSVPMTATEDVVLGSIAITKHTDQPAIPEQDAPAPETESPTEEETTVPEEQQTESLSLIHI